MKTWFLVVLTVFSFGILIVGALHIPILAVIGVDVFSFRGILMFTALPVFIVFSIPFCVCVTTLLKRKFEKRKK